MSQYPSNVSPKLVAELKHYRKLGALDLHDEVKMALPEGARVKTEHGAWKVRWRKYQFFVGPLSKEEYQGQVALLSQPATGNYAHFYSITVMPVTFGGVRGVKQMRVIREVGSKSVNYALEVAGGFAFAGIVRRGVEWDESEWEQFFSSIQITKR